MRYLLMVLLVAAALLAWALQNGRLAVPPDWNPWAPLDVKAEPNLLTGYKLQRLANEPALCLAILDGSALTHTTVPDNTTADGSCGWQNAVRVADARFAPAFTLTCSASVALALWERHSVQPAAQARFGQAVTGIDHLGSYACRNVRGAAGEGTRRSQHATANAFDVAGFRLADGRRIRLLADWEGDDAEAGFLRDVHQGACRFFNGTLGPDYNAAHRDHLHLERGGFRICR